MLDALQLAMPALNDMATRDMQILTNLINKIIFIVLNIAQFDIIWRHFI